MRDDGKEGRAREWGGRGEGDRKKRIVLSPLLTPRPPPPRGPLEARR